MTKETNTKSTSFTPEHETEFTNMVNLLAVYSEASNQIIQLEAEATDERLEQMDERRLTFARLQETLTKASTALETIALAHPEWFANRKSIKTPYGTVKFKTSTKLEVPNQEVSILLIEKEAEKNPEFKHSTYLGTSTCLRLEALEKLTDAELAKFRIKRITTDNFSVEPAKVDMGKAVKESAVKEGA